MSEVFLSLIPTYGVWIILLSVTLSCMALPVPSSMMVMVAGGFASSDEFSIWQLVFFAYAGFVLGDQLAFWIARYAGRPFLTKLETSERTGAVVGKAKTLVAKGGIAAVFLSRTVLSPLGPYVGYVSGALGMAWIKFTSTAIVAAFIWSCAYAWLGYTFADRISNIASLISSSVGIVIAGAVAVLGIIWLVRSYRAGRIAQDN